MHTNYNVAADKSGSYQRQISAATPKDAAEIWAAWYCQRTAEFRSPLTGFVRDAFGDWHEYEIEIESVSYFHASAV